MTDLERLLDESPSPRTRALLRAGQAETAPAGFCEQLGLSVGAAAAVGAVATGVAASLSTSAKLGGGVSGVSGVASGAIGSPSLALVAAKWVAVGVLGGGILGAGVELAFAPQRAKWSEPRSTSVRVAGSVASSAKAEAHPDATAIEPEKPSLVVASSPSAQIATPASASSASRSRQLGREVEVIDRVRRALALGNSALALSELDSFARLTTTGVLDREARVLRIRALREAGDAAGARKLADQYLLDFPNDAHAARMRSQDLGRKP
ncbi:MAG TPA: hypothetical protein VEX18_08120 [Polyangiaceae bacterium]|nr:hypothetical protein [Polyangiaceae bacterium]